MVTTSQQALDLRDSGTQRAVERDEEWVTDARRYVEQVLRPGDLFTAEDLNRFNMRLPYGSHNAVGGLLVSLSRAGIIEATDRTVRSSRLARRGGWVRVWRRR